MVKAKQARRSGFPGCVPAFVFVPVPAQPPEVASASTPAVRQQIKANETKLALGVLGGFAVLAGVLALATSGG